MKMRSIFTQSLFALALLFVTAFLPTQEVRAQSSDQFVPIAFQTSACNEEAVFVEGGVKIVSKLTTDAAGGTHFNEHINVILDGEGEVTGTKYLWRDAIKTTENITAGGTETSSIIQRLKFIGKGAAANLMFKIDFKFTSTPSGEVVVDVLNFDFNCEE